MTLKPYRPWVFTKAAERIASGKNHLIYAAISCSRKTLSGTSEERTLFCEMFQASKNNPMPELFSHEVSIENQLARIRALFQARREARRRNREAMRGER